MEAVILSPGKELMSKPDVARYLRVSNRFGSQINNPTAASQALRTSGHGGMHDQVLALTEPLPNSHLLCTAAGEGSVTLRRGTWHPFSVYPAPSLVPATKEG